MKAAPSRQEDALAPRTAAPSRGAGFRRFVRHRTAVACLATLGLIVFASAFGPFFTGYGYEQTSDLQFAPPSRQHLFGTDLHGRDVLTRVLYGGRISLAVGLIGALVSLTGGVAWGMIAGYRGGRTDLAMMRFVDVLYSLPRLVFVIVLVTALDPPLREGLQRLGFVSLAGSARILLLFAGLGIVSWLTMARIVRGQVLALKEQQFVLAARAMGAGGRRILGRHLLPNLWGIVIVYLTLTIPAVILDESFLSFLGLGIQAPQSSWGSLVSDGAAAINPIRIYWWLLVFPGAAMAVTLLALNLLGDQLRDLLDPRTVRGRE
ncbi:MAG: ABC transporter permease [Verrucomicrobiae bacterium]|nr:ABC transporter permease [Verrucomicrobiae bacterium]